MKTPKSLLPSYSRNLLSQFDDFFNEFTSPILRRRSGQLPSVNVSETDEEYKVTFAIPGAKKDDVNVEIQGDVLCVSSKTEDSTEVSEEDYTRREWGYSSFSRCMVLPDNVDRDAVDAQMENGVLCLTIKKSESKSSKSQSIEIK